MHFFKFLLGFLNRYPQLRFQLVRLARKFGLYHGLVNFFRSVTSRDDKHFNRQLTSYETRFFSMLDNALHLPAPPMFASRQRKRLAFVSPLLPLKTGISHYSGTLLPLLAELYDIDVIVEQNSVTDDWVNEHCAIRTADWLKHHPHDYDRVMYHFGNSPFHEYMFDLLTCVPGVVVLHDFFLGHLASKKYYKDFSTHLYYCHGYSSVLEMQKTDQETVVWRYPLNLDILHNALNIIVHSPYNQALAKQFYGDSAAKKWSVIPHLKVPSKKISKATARTTLGLNKDDFIVCSFGFTGPIKLNHRLLEAWLASDLLNDERCILLFVGENDAGEYGASLLAQIKQSKLKARIRITGWMNNEDYLNYLAAADIGVQLRARSRGETSGAVLDCMNSGLATIANANGTMADLPGSAVHLIADEFSHAELSSALELLYSRADYRSELVAHAYTQIADFHNPGACAQQYVDTIESAYNSAQANLLPFLKSVTSAEIVNASADNLTLMARSLAGNYPPDFQQAQLLIDISALVMSDLKTGIQRVVRAQLEILLRHPPKGVRVEPVYLSDHGGFWHYKKAQNWTCQFLNISPWLAEGDSMVRFNQGDVLFCADLSSDITKHAADGGVYKSIMSSGAKVFFQVFDLLPISHPEWFPPGAMDSHIDRSSVVAQSDGAICISHAVADDFKAWSSTQEGSTIRDEAISYFHLGADIDTSSPSKGLPNNADGILGALSASASFLMVGTIEPRKGQAQSLAAFELLWAQGVDVNLVIVGNEGWMIGKLAKALANHPELNKRLFWLKSISDEFLNLVYDASHCLVFSSEAEGFGLPLIEAAQHELPIIARNIPVFREVAGEYAYYFEGLSAEDLSTAILAWLALDKAGNAPSSLGMPWLTWRESTEQVVRLLGLEPT